jgi:hypothetical protein
MQATLDALSRRAEEQGVPPAVRAALQDVERAAAEPAGE